MAFIPTGISSSRKTPGIIVEIRFAQGEGSSANLSRDILLIGDMTTDGYASADDTVYELQNETDAKHYFGARSEVHRMFRRVAANNRGVRVFGIGVTEPVAGAVADGYFNVTGTAVKPGAVEAWVAGQRVSVAFAKDDTASTVATALKNAINAISFLPVVATINSGSVRLVAVQKGTAANNIVIWSSVTAGSGITVTDIAMANGTGESDISDALDAIASSSYYYQVLARNDATNVQALTAQLKLMNEPTTGVDQVGIFGSVASVATAAAVAQNGNVNCERMQCVQLELAQTPACEIAATLAALRAKYEISDWGFNFNGLQMPGIVGPHSTSDNPTASDIESALSSGLSPLAIDKFGGVSLVSSCTTRSLNGTDPDYRVRKTYVVSVCDAFKAELHSDLVASFKGKKVSEDVDKVLPNTAMPKHLRAKVIKWVGEYTSKPWLAPDKAQDMVDSISAVKSTGTLSAQFTLFCAEDLDHVYAIGLEASEPQ